MKTFRKLLLGSACLIFLSLAATSCGSSNTNGCGYWGYEELPQETPTKNNTSEYKVYCKASKNS